MLKNCLCYMSPRARVSKLGLFSACGLIAAAGSALAQTATVEIIATTGLRPTGLVASETLAQPFSNYTMTGAGPFWTSYITGPSVNSYTNTGVFSGSAPRLVVRAGDNLPGGSPYIRGNLTWLQRLSVTPSGLAYYYLGDDINSNTLSYVPAIWGGTTAGGLRLIGRIGDNLPGGSLTPTYSRFYDGGTGGINDAGTVVYQTTLAGTGINTTNNDVIMVAAGGTRSILVQEGNQVPGIPGAVFGDFSGGSGLTSVSYAAHINNNADIVFNAPFYGGGVTNLNNKAMLTARSTADMRVILREGDAAPGFAAGTAIYDFDRPTLTTNGYLSVLVSVNRLGNTRTVSYAYGPAGWTRHLATKDDQPPGFPAPWYVASITDSWIGDNGGILTTGSAKRDSNVEPPVTGATATAIWYGLLGQSQLVVATNAFAPGLGVPSAHFTGFGTPAANSRGEVVFMASALGTVNNVHSKYYGIWAWDNVRGLRLLVRNGQTVNTSGSVTNTIADLTLQTVDDSFNPLSPQASAINDAGDVIFWANFVNSFSALCSANVRAVGQSLPVFRPTSAPAIESPAIFTVRNSEQGNYQVSAFRVNGNGLESTGYLGYSDDPSWQVVGNADFNADGFLDVVWHNTVSGYCVVWIMQSGLPWPSRVAWLGDSDAAGGWRIRAVCDMDRNGVPDIVWQNQNTGYAGTWLFSRSGDNFGLTWRDFWGPNNLPWNIKAAADMTGDGQPDLIVRYEGPSGNPANGNMFVWGLKNLASDGLTWMSGVSDLNWKLIGVADADRDGGNDLLWWWTGGGIYNGALSYWRMSGTRFLEARSIYGSVNPANNSIAPITPVLVR